MAGVVVATRRSLLPLALAAALSGCGFRPMYASAGNGSMGPAEAGLAQISIGPLAERSGQLLRQALQARFERGGGGAARRYDLTVAYGMGGEAIAIQPDSSVSRIRLVGTANWTLTAQDPQRSTLASGTARALDGYNLLDTQSFAGDMENDMVQRRIAEAVADQITLQLAAYFNKHAGP
jgi:LPS-assembly lipoprotein